VPNSEVQRLRDEVRKRRSDVTSKIGRIRRNTGVDVAGTNEDPRRDPKVISRYSKPQLAKYLADLNAFQSRGVGFVAGNRGAIIPKRAWQEYKKLERQYNKLGQLHEAAIANIKVPGLGVTVRERNAMIHPNAIGEVVNRPYVEINRKANQVRSVEKLRELTKGLAKKISPTFLPGEIRKARKQLNDMLKTIGSNEYAGRAKKLTDNQFNILWNYTNFATNISLRYEITKLQAAGSEDRWYSSVLEDNEDDLRELFDSAEQFPEAENNSQSETQTKQNRRKRS
jgi:hypothetical protein